MVATILVACGVFTLLRTGGITGDADSDLHWRWTKTPEERLLAQLATSRWRSRRLRQQPTKRRIGPVFADLSATASFAECESGRTGLRRHLSSCGAGRSDRAGRPSRSAETFSTPRSSAVTTRSSPATR